MSGEGAIGLAVFAVVGGGVIVASRLAVGATGMLGAGLAAIGDRSDAAYHQWEQEQQAAAVWECAAREVVDRNACIAVLLAHAGDEAASEAGIPTPYRLAGQPVDELRDWTARADRALADAEHAMGKRASHAVQAFLGSVLAAAAPRPGAPTPRPITADDALARYRALHLTAGTASPVVGAADVARIVERLAVDAADADRAAVLAAAAAVATRQGGDQRSQLQELRERVRRANATAKTGREGRLTAAIYLQALESSDATLLRDRLATVVAGHRELDPGLDADAVRECSRVREVEEIAYVRRCATAALASLGYTVDSGFATHVGSVDRLRLTREDWKEHAIGVVVEEGEVRTSVIRTASRAGGDALQLDREREEQWCEDFELLQSELAQAGLDVEVTALKHPGERPVPVAVRSGTRRDDAATQERSRDGRT